MNAPSPSLPSATPGAVNPSPFALAVLRAVTWKALLGTQFLGLVVALARTLQERDADTALLSYLQGRNPAIAPHLLNSHFVVASLGALFVMLGALAADEAIRRGRGFAAAYSVALLGACCATAVTQWYLRAWLGVGAAEHPAGATGAIVRVGLVGLDVSVLGGLAMLAFLNRRSANRMLDGVRNAELERVRVERRLLDSRLATTQAYIDPVSLLAKVAGIRDLYSTSHAGANEQLEALIQELRGRVARNLAAEPSREVLQ